MPTRVFLYELAACGGSPIDGIDLQLCDALRAEGSAMLDALAADFAAVKGVQTTVLREPSEKQFLAAAENADWTVVIAPETDDILARLVRKVGHAGGRVLGPDVDQIRLAGDKHYMAERLEHFNVPVVEGVLIVPGDRWPEKFGYPAVLKPCEGCGSQGIRVLGSDPRKMKVAVRSRLELYCAGLACSVAVLCGPATRVALEPCRQHVDSRKNMRYEGGSLPLPELLAARARKLADRAVETLGPTRGWIGVDLVLGHDESGADDRVIEINPRLTTSYVGLRAATSYNLAAAMLEVAQGETPAIPFDRGAVTFRADGTVMRGEVVS
jgi:predicted ATP-grasp superfamily ATP-dependent carboligase